MCNPAKFSERMTGCMTQVQCVGTSEARLEAGRFCTTWPTADCGWCCGSSDMNHMLYGPQASVPYGLIMYWLRLYGPTSSDTGCGA